MFHFQHLSNVCMNYREHFLFSFHLSYIFFNASVKALIHSFVPNLFITSSSETVKKIDLLIQNSGCKDQNMKNN